MIDPIELWRLTEHEKIERDYGEYMLRLSRTMAPGPGKRLEAEAIDALARADAMKKQIGEMQNERAA